MDTFCPCGMCAENRRTRQWSRPQRGEEDVSTAADIRRLMQRRLVRVDVYKGRLSLDGATLKVTAHG